MSIRSYLAHLNRRDTRILPKFSTIVITTIIALTVMATFSLVSQSKAIGNIIYEQQKAIEEQKNNSSYLLYEYTRARSVITLNALIGHVSVDEQGNLKTGWVPGGIVGSANKIAGIMFTPAASGVEYLASVKDSFLGKPAYAQGVGFYGLQPILPIWREMRNTIYVLSSFFFIIIGFMVMLRIKISPQATISIQNAIPQLVTTLILVTFSYAIAGLIIDLSYVFQGMAVVIIYPGLATNGPLAWLLNVLSGLPYVGKILPSLASFVEPNSLTVALHLIAPAIVTSLLAGVVVNLIGIMFSALGGPLGGPIVIGITSVIVLIIVIIAIIFWMIKFITGLLKCYATIIFKIIIAPLEIGMGAFPNSKMGFSSWVYDVIANVAVFPISFIVLLLSNKIIGLILVGQVVFTAKELISWVTTLGQSGNLPAWTGLWVPSLLGGSDVAPGAIIAAGAIGLSTLTLLSKLPEMIPEFIFMIKPSPWGNAVGEGIKEVTGAPGRAAGLLHTYTGFQDDRRRIMPPPPRAPRAPRAIPHPRPAGYVPPAAPAAGGPPLPPVPPGPGP